MRQRPSYLLFVLRLLGLIFVTIAWLCIWGIASLFVWGAKRRKALVDNLLQKWGRSAAWICGYEIEVIGEIPKRGTFLAPNHISYADIIVLSCIAPCNFISKAEVAKLPIIGFAATRVGTIYVSRRRERKLGDTHEQISTRLRNQSHVVVFLESTTSDGQRLLPFRSSLLQGAIDAKAPVTPIAMQWRTDNPNLDVIEDIAFWRDDHKLMPHLVNHLGRNSKKVTVRIGEPVDTDLFQCRKSLSEYVYSQVKALLDAI